MEELKKARTKTKTEQPKNEKKKKKNRAQFIVCVLYDSRANPTERETRAEFQKMDEWLNGWTANRWAEFWPEALASPVGTWESSFGSDNPGMAKSNYRK